MAKKNSQLSIVESICGVQACASGLNWFKRLPQELQDICVETRTRVKDQNLRHYVVAESLAKYLSEHGVMTTSGTIARWLGNAKKA